jgi:hypothetical protein
MLGDDCLGKEIMRFKVDSNVIFRSIIFSIKRGQKHIFTKFLASISLLLGSMFKIRKKTL